MISRNKSISSKDPLSEPIRIPASSKFIKRFTGTANKTYLGSFIIFLSMMGAFIGSFFSAKLIYLVPILGTVYWGLLFFSLIGITLLVVPRKERDHVEFKILGFAILLLFFLNGGTLLILLYGPSNILAQRASAAASMASLLIPVWIWNASRKIKIASSLEGESGKET